MENKRLFAKLCLLQRQMYRRNSKLFLDLGVTPVQMNALMFIHKMTARGQNVMQKDVEKHVGLRPSSVSTLLTNLEKDGYLLRKVDGDDARAKFLTLTDKGIDLCLKNKMLMDECDGEIQRALTEAEQKDFERLLIKIIDEISKNEKERV
ncbi:MAG: winged helix-turn-helix transcriptional regulator [Clostridia bacterium]|nr:winged helix-turn-helix transcriptional regulator [Clostridia bacterium]